MAATQKDVISLYVQAGNDSLGINSVYVLNDENELEKDKDPDFPALYIVPMAGTLADVTTNYTFNIIVLAGSAADEVQIDPTGASETLAQWDTAVVDAEDQALGLLHGVLGRVSANGANQVTYNIARGAINKSQLKFAGWRCVVSITFDSQYREVDFATS